MDTTQAPPVLSKIPPRGKKFIEFKADKCDEALSLKKKIERLQEKLSGLTLELETIFEMDNKEYFSELGHVKLDQSKSYSIDESNLDKARTKLIDLNLVIDDYITQKTSWGITAKLRSLIKEEGNPLASLVTIKETKRISLKAS